VGNRTHGRDRLHPRDACGWRAGREVEGLLRVGVPTLGRLGSLEGGLARAKRVVVIVVAVVVIRRAGSAVQMNVGALPPAWWWTRIPGRGMATVATKAASVADARCSIRGRRIIRWMPAPAQNSFTSRSRRSLMSCSMRA